MCVCVPARLGEVCCECAGFKIIGEEKEGREKDIGRLDGTNVSGFDRAFTEYFKIK